jgi:hypothetical protein
LRPGQTANYLPEILRDLGLLALAAWVVVRPPGRVALDSALGLAPGPDDRADGHPYGDHDGDHDGDAGDDGDEDPNDDPHEENQ